MNRSKQVFRTIGAALSVVVVAGACVTPQIPLPPPRIDLMGVTVADPGREVIELSSPENDRTRGARVMIVNERTGDGVITTAAQDGSFHTMPFAAAEGDQLFIYYRRIDEYSDDACGVVNYASGGLDECPTQP